MKKEKNFKESKTTKRYNTTLQENHEIETNF